MRVCMLAHVAWRSIEVAVRCACGMGAAQGGELHSRLIRHVTRATHTPPGWDRPACGRVVVGAHQRSTTPSSATNSELPVLMQTERLRGSSGRRARTHGSAGGNSFPRQDRRGLLEPKLHAPALPSSTNYLTPSIASCRVHSRSAFCSFSADYIQPVPSW